MRANRSSLSSVLFLCIAGSLITSGWCAAADADRVLSQVAQCVSLGGTVSGDLAPPTRLHWLRLEDRVRLVFSRSADDVVDASRVSHYVVCASDRGCVKTTANFVEFPRTVEKSKTGFGAMVFAVGALGRASCGSAVSALDRDLTIDGRITAISEKALGPQPQCYATPPKTVYSPVSGPLVIFHCTTCTNATTMEWGFLQHQSGAHRPGGGINAADDTLAWDANLNVTGAGPNMDVNMEFMATGYGWATTWGGVAPGTGSWKAILIDHCGWFSGYLHAAAVYVRTGDYLTPWTILGRIGHTGADNDHLHFAVYGGRNVYGGLVSYDATILVNPAVILFSQPGSIAVGQSVALHAVASRAHAATSSSVLPAVDLSSPSVTANTYWKTSDARIVVVDGNGKITGKARGSATITLYYSGTKASLLITVR